MSVAVRWLLPHVYIKLINSPVINFVKFKSVHNEIFVFYSSKMLKVKNIHFKTCVSSEGSDEPTHLCSLARNNAACTNKVGM